MRDIALSLFVFAGLLVTFRFPFAGMLIWVLLSIMNPHQETYSFAQNIQWNLIVAVVTIASWLVSRERKLPPDGFTTTAILVLLAWTTLNTFFAFDPAWSWVYWNRAWKTVAMGVLAGILTTNRVRFQALIWMVALSLGYYGIKGGIFTLMTGGTNRVFGPPDSMLGDNNQLGLALVMVLPLLHFLRVHSASRWIRAGLLFSLVLTLAAIFGTYSRESYIALGAVVIAFWLSTRKKLRYSAIGALVFIPLLMLMPASFYERAASIQQYNTDVSFQSRLDSWWVAWRYAMDHAPFGAGFYGMNLQGLWNQYIPGEMHAAHSIYFQVLGEQGIVGLALYLLVLLAGVLRLRSVHRETRNIPALRWEYDAAQALWLSLLAFCVGGAAAPMAFFDLLFLWVMLSGTLLYIARQALGQRRDDIAAPDTYETQAVELPRAGV